MSYDRLSAEYEKESPEGVLSRNTLVGRSYIDAMARLAMRRQEETGNKYPSPEEIYAIATTIQAARTRIVEDPAVKTHIKGLKVHSPEKLVIYLRELSKDGEAHQALNTLVESHLPFAYYLARASMNMSTKIEEDELESDVDLQKKKRIKRPGAFSDIRKLRSPKAVLDDRIQVANLALINAAWNYDPSAVGREGRSASFMGFSEWYIHAALHRHVVGAGESIAVDYPASAAEKYSKDWKRWDELDVYQRLEIIEFDALRAPLDIDSLEEDIPEEVGLDDVLNDRALQSTVSDVLGSLGEREAGVIRARFGLGGGNPLTLDEIGDRYGITRERVRQIESKALGKLRHPSRVSPLKVFMSGDEPAGTQVGPTHKSWQAHPNEKWDDLVRRLPIEKEISKEEVAQALVRLFHEGANASFRQPKRSYAEHLFPAGLFEKIKNEIGSHLKTEHIEAAWNESLEQIIEQARGKLGEAFKQDRVTQLFSRLLVEYMKDSDVVELTIPESLDGKLNYVGAWLPNGHLIVNGNLGSYAGASASGLGKIQINGNVKDHVGHGAHEYSAIEVTGNAGDFAGSAMRGNANLIVKGSTGDYCGFTLSSSDATVLIEGNAGLRVAHRAHKGNIHIQGTVESLDIPRNFKGEIMFGGIA